jgi:hypothetical protein
MEHSLLNKTDSGKSQKRFFHCLLNPPLTFHCQNLPPSLTILDMNPPLNSQPPPCYPYSIRFLTMMPGSGTGASSTLFKYPTRCRHNIRYPAILGSITSSSSLCCKLLMWHRPSPKPFPKGLSTTSLLYKMLTWRLPSPTPVLKCQPFHLEFQGRMYSRVLSFFCQHHHFLPFQPPPWFILRCFDRIYLKLETLHRNFCRSYICLSTTLLLQCQAAPSSWPPVHLRCINH